MKPFSKIIRFSHDHSTVSVSCTWMVSTLQPLCNSRPWTRTRDHGVNHLSSTCWLIVPIHSTDNTLLTTCLSGRLLCWVTSTCSANRSRSPHQTCSSGYFWERDKLGYHSNASDWRYLQPLKKAELLTKRSKLFLLNQVTSAVILKKCNTI